MALFFCLKNFKHKIETSKNDYHDRDYLINISIPEFSCLCPKTGLPDYAIIKIDYIPNKLLVELKSLKYYILNFRNFGIFHEHATNLILDDFKKACKPKEITVTSLFNSRGGINTTVKASWPK